MCSISGIIAKDEEGSGSRSLLKNIQKHVINMMKILKHRGPDYSGMMFDDEVLYFENFDDITENTETISRMAMGHNRLAIVGTAVQPIPNTDESIWIICNGEIYNHVELRDELSVEHEFKTDTDSEAIIHTYEDELVDVLDGDYAYAIYDKEKNIIELRRDLMGVKPLYYIDTDEYFAFASEK
jgi:asparagine synthase (glutamine-hydrolysing)